MEAEPKKKMRTFKEFMGDTFNFTYIKGLIAGENNKDLRELMAVWLTVTAIISFGYSIWVAKTDDARLYLIITLFSFIAALFGMDAWGKKKSDLPIPKDEKEAIN